MIHLLWLFSISIFRFWGPFFTFFCLSRYKASKGTTGRYCTNSGNLNSHAGMVIVAVLVDLGLDMGVQVVSNGKTMKRLDPSCAFFDYCRCLFPQDMRPNLKEARSLAYSVRNANSGGNEVCLFCQTCRFIKLEFNLYALLLRFFLFLGGG